MQGNSMTRKRSFTYLNMQVTYGASKTTKFNWIIFKFSKITQPSWSWMGLHIFLQLKHFPIWIGWIQLSARRQMQRCFLMCHLINDNDRNDTIVRGVDYHIENTRSKDTIRFIKSSSNWGLLRSVNSAFTELQPHNTCVQPFSFSLSFGPDN